MSGIAILGAVIVVALTNVLAGLLPVAFTGDAQLAVWLTSLLIGVVVYVSLNQAVDR